MSKTAVGLFEDEAKATQVVRELESSGFKRDQIRMVNRLRATPTPSGLDRPDVRADAGTGALVGNTEVLKIGGVPEEDAALYMEGVRRGSVLVAVTSSDDCADEAARIMDRAGAIDVRERSRAAGRGMSPPSGEGTVQAGRHRVEGGGTRVFIW